MPSPLQSADKKMYFSLGCTRSTKATPILVGMTHSLNFRISPDFPGMPSWSSHLWIILSEYFRKGLDSNYFVRGRSALGWALKRHLLCSIATDSWHSRIPLNRIYSIPTRIYSLKVV